MYLSRKNVIYLFLMAVLSVCLVYHFFTSEQQKLSSANHVSLAKISVINELAENGITVNTTDLKAIRTQIKVGPTEFGKTLSKKSIINHSTKRQRIPSDFLSNTRTLLVLDEVRELVVYSSHYDHTDKTLKLVGFGPRGRDVTTQLQDYQCLLLDVEGKEFDRASLSVHYRVTRDPGRPDIIYDTIIYSCGSSSISPHALSVVSSSKNSSLNLPIEPTPASEHPNNTHTFAVCVKPMYDYTDVDMLRNFLAVNTALGAEHFYFYVFSASVEVISTLRSLKEKVTLYQWPLNHLAGKVHAYGQKTHNAHCLYAHKSFNKYLVFIDIDEILVPDSHKSWNEMMKDVKYRHPHSGAVVFRSRLFPVNSPINAGHENYSLASLKFTKATRLFPYHHWSKLLVDTSRADNVDIHWVNKLYSGFEVTYANHSFGSIYHYREFRYNYRELHDLTLLSSRFKGDILNVYSQMFS